MKRFFGILFGLTAMVALAVSASAQTPAAAHQVHKGHETKVSKRS